MKILAVVFWSALPFVVLWLLGWPWLWPPVMGLSVWWAWRDARKARVRAWREPTTVWQAVGGPVIYPQWRMERGSWELTQPLGLYDGEPKTDLDGAS